MKSFIQTECPSFNVICKTYSFRTAVGHHQSTIERGIEVNLQQLPYNLEILLKKIKLNF